MYVFVGKRALDLFVAICVLFVTWPLIALALILVYFYDYANPVYFAPRVGKNFIRFKMYKIRTMVVDADLNGVDSTKDGDHRVLPIAGVIRRLKLDELLQLVNVLKGDMSLVGPRPNVESEVGLYSQDEQTLLSGLPGITDISSIVFSDLGSILQTSSDPNLDYNQLVRPWKSRLGLFYLKRSSFFLDFELLFLTVFNPFFRKTVLKRLSSITSSESKALSEVVLRNQPLVPSAPPGLKEIVTQR